MGVRNETHHLQLILPELLLVCLVEKWEVANMVDEDVPQDRQLRIHGRDLAVLRSKGRTESLQRGGGVQFENFAADLTGDELALEICAQRRDVSDPDSDPVDPN